MAVTLVQTPAPSSNASNTFATGVTAGNTVFLTIFAFAFSNTTITSSAPLLGGSSVTGATLLKAESSPFTTGSGVVYAGFWMLPNVPGGATSVSVTVGGGGTAFSLYAYEVSGLGTTPTLDQFAIAGNGNSANPASGTTGATTTANEFVLGAGIMLSVALASPGAPWTAVAGPSSFAWGGYQIQSASGATYSWSQSSGGSTNAWAAGVVTVASSAGGVTPAPLYPLKTAIRSPIQLPPRGRDAGTKAAAPLSFLGPPFRQAPRPAQARQPLPPRGRTRASAGGSFSGIGPPFRQAAQPARSRILPPPRGRAGHGGLGTFSSQGPAFRQAAQPIRSRILPPPRGWNRGTAGIFSSQGPAFIPLRRPVMSVRLAPPRGRAQGLLAPPPVFVPPGTGPQLYPLHGPVKARQLPLQGGRIRGTAGTYGGQGPAFTLLRQPVRPRALAAFFRGIIRRAAGAFSGQGPVPAPPHRSVSSVRLPAPRGRTSYSHVVVIPFIPTPGPPIPPRGTPVMARPLPLRGGRVMLTRPYVPPVPSSHSIAVHVSIPESSWETGVPRTAWRAAGPESAWAARTPR